MMKMIFLVLFFLTHCKRDLQPAGSSPEKNSSELEEPGVEKPAKGLDLVEPRPPVASEYLRVKGFEIEQSRKDGVIFLDLSLEEPLGDYLSYSVCSKETDRCLEGWFGVKEEIPLDFFGPIEVRVRVCVERYRTVDSPCGASFKTVFLAKKEGDLGSLQKLYFERYELRQKLKKLAFQVEELIQGLAPRERTGALQGWVNQGPYRSGEFYGSQMFRDLALGFGSGQGLGLAEGEGSWAYPDGDVPQGKVVKKKTQDEEERDEVLRKAGALLLVTGVAAVGIGMAMTMPNLQEESVFQRITMFIEKLPEGGAERLKWEGELNKLKDTLKNKSLEGDFSPGKQHNLEGEDKTKDLDKITEKLKQAFKDAEAILAKTEKMPPAQQKAAMKWTNPNEGRNRTMGKAALLSGLVGIGVGIMGINEFGPQLATSETDTFKAQLSTLMGEGIRILGRIQGIDDLLLAN
jgi:hypothetical protein